MLSITNRDGAVTTVQVIAEAGSITADLEIVGTGQARLRPGDLDVHATGERIALGRALQDFGRQVEEAGLDESVGLDDVERVINAIVLKAFEG